MRGTQIYIIFIISSKLRLLNQEVFPNWKEKLLGDGDSLVKESNWLETSFDQDILALLT